MVIKAQHLTLVISLCFSLLAHGQSESDLQIAKQQYSLGKTYYNQAAYDKALPLFEQAYKLSKRPLLLYNIARCYEALAKLPEAVDHYQKYLKFSKKNDPVTEARIKNLKARIKAQEKQTAVVKKTDQVVQKKKEDVAKVEKAVAKEKDKVDLIPTSQPESEEESGSSIHWMKWTGWGLIGAGAVLIGTGTYFGIRASKRASEVEDAQNAGRDWADIKDFADEGNTFETISIVTIISGVVFAGGGTALWLLAPSDDETISNLRITPSIGENGVGLMTSFQF